jgi:hypothetical protein
MTHQRCCQTQCIDTSLVDSGSYCSASNAKRDVNGSPISLSFGMSQVVHYRSTCLFYDYFVAAMHSSCSAGNQLILYSGVDGDPNSVVVAARVSNFAILN